MARRLKAADIERLENTSFVAAVGLQAGTLPDHPVNVTCPDVSCVNCTAFTCNGVSCTGAAVCNTGPQNCWALTLPR